ncbi:MAG: class I SAM-dependent methyltransferase [Chloroflexi bacterium]|nr:class I SAM-dependent methyltransferase [Chloroflexota bacterium]
MTSSMSIEKATLYEKYRLPYANEAIDGLLQRIGKVEVVADIGAGTGQLARLFAGKCDTVYAVEPDATMRKVAHDTLTSSKVVIIEGTAECTPIEAKSVDLIVVGNAFHRFRPEACIEFARILRPTGWVAIFSYNFLDKAFVDSLFSKLALIEGLASRSKRAWHNTPLGDLFGKSEVFTLQCEQSCVEGWDEFFGAACAGIESPERNDEEFEQFERINREVFEEFSRDGNITLHYATRISFGQLE